MLENININCAERSEVIDVDLLLLTVPPTSCDSLCHCRVILVLTLNEQGRYEDDVVCIGEISA